MEPEPSPSTFFPLPFLVAIIVVLLLLSLLCSISESSFLAMNKLRLRIKRRKGDSRALIVSKLLSKKELLINALLVANDMTNILLSSILTAVSVKLFGASGVAYATFVATVLLLLFGEITPKTISTRHADSIAYALSGFVSVVVNIFKPLSILLTKVAEFVLRLFGVNFGKKNLSYTEDEIRTFVDYGGEEGAIDEDENAIMRRIFKFTDLEAQDVMTPRTQIVALPDTSTYGEILELAKKTNFPRFPVYRETIDNIVGVLYLKDLLSYSQENFSLAKAMREPLFVLGTKKISGVRQLLRENWQTLAVVVDEYSGTDGILTQEDIAERIFWQISASANGDELSAANDGEAEATDFFVDGSILLADISERLGVLLESEIYETLGGWIEEKLDRLAIAGDFVNYGGWRFVVENVEMRRIVSVHVKAEEAGDSESASGDAGEGSSEAAGDFGEVAT